MPKLAAFERRVEMRRSSRIDGTVEPPVTETVRRAARNLFSGTVDLYGCRAGEAERLAADGDEEVERG